ncbi:hypothetical protein [Pseudonocardia humida]|uniref:PE family protein n=1 Tax=Pseudonocardia humida TaxID=2800819 RepID=A0ABT0ZVP5_9PSEU|nr:hypothetical protein [Pseudonocardia humida]MCO1654811.1 hypothetical protein [Pseudonocardia humida]
MAPPDSGFRIDYDAIPRAVATYDQVLDRLGAILNRVRRSARIEPWAQDRVSVAMAAHYNEQIFGPDLTGTSPYCTYGALKLYERELVAARDALQRTYAEYLRAEAEAANSFTKS